MAKITLEIMRHLGAELRKWLAAAGSTHRARIDASRGSRGLLRYRTWA
jgi:hypothetical protein